jgi:hypothetical protein
VGRLIGRDRGLARQAGLVAQQTFNPHLGKALDQVRRVATDELASFPWSMRKKSAVEKRSLLPEG